MGDVRVTYQPGRRPRESTLHQEVDSEPCVGRRNDILGAPDERAEVLIRDQRHGSHATGLAGVLGALGPRNTHGASRSAGPNSRFGSIRISGRWLQCRLVMRRAYVWYARLSFAAFHPGALPAGSVCARGLEYASCSRCVDRAQGAPVDGVAAYWGGPTQMRDEAC